MLTLQQYPQQYGSSSSSSFVYLVLVSRGVLLAKEVCGPVGKVEEEKHEGEGEAGEDVDLCAASGLAAEPAPGHDAEAATLVVVVARDDLGEGESSEVLKVLVGL